MMDEQTEAYLDRQDMQDQIEQNEDMQGAYEDAGFEHQFSGAEAPLEKKPDSLYTLFQKVWSSPDSSKVANLDKFELGKLSVTVRDAQYLELLARTLKHPTFGEFWKAQGEIMLATSASKKGWFTELFVSQKKFTSRSGALSGEPQNQGKKKWSLFGTTQTQADNSE